MFLASTLISWMTPWIVTLAKSRPGSSGCSNWCDFVVRKVMPNLYVILYFFVFVLLRYKSSNKSSSPFVAYMSLNLYTQILHLFHTTQPIRFGQIKRCKFQLTI
jgi:hypothetical protein